MDYFLDTYAMIEIVKGNEDYKKYLNMKFITTKYNLAELHYFILTRFDLKTADLYLKKFSVYVVDFSIEVISKAMIFRKKMREDIDCLGYLVAITNSAKFLTGDDHFKNLPHVEFIK